MQLRTACAVAFLLVIVLTRGVAATLEPLSETHSEPYLLRSYYDEENGEGFFEIVRGEERVYCEEIPGKAWAVSVPLDHRQTWEEADGVRPRDITGDGIPDLVVMLWTGGAHGWWGFWVFSLGPELRKVAQFEPTDNGMQFDDLDGDGVFEALVLEDTFDYWHAPHSESPVPIVVLRFTEGSYHFAPDLMRKAAPSREDFENRLLEIGGLMEEWTPGPFSEPPSALWGYMIELIYSGNGDLAWQFFEAAWPDHKPGKPEFLEEFKARLAEGPYWPEIKRLNNWE